MKFWANQSKADQIHPCSGPIAPDEMKTSCELASLNGHLDYLWYAYKHGSVWGKTCENAARNGHSDCLQFAFKHGAYSGDGQDLAIIAAENRHFNTLSIIIRFCKIRNYKPEFYCKLVEVGQRDFTDLAMTLLAYTKSSGDASYFDFVCDNLMPIAVNNDSLGCIKSIFHGCKVAHQLRPVNTRIIRCAIIRGGDGTVLKFLLDEQLCKDCSVDISLCDIAARHGNLQCLKVLYEKGGKLTPLTVMKAVEHGHLDCLKFIHEEGCIALSPLVLDIAKEHLSDTSSTDDPFDQIINYYEGLNKKCA